jgi:hypothetical protein
MRTIGKPGFFAGRVRVTHEEHPRCALDGKPIPADRDSARTIYCSVKCNGVATALRRRGKAHLINGHYEFKEVRNNKATNKPPVE